jgi:hypothetical protein
MRFGASACGGAVEESVGHLHPPQRSSRAVATTQARKHPIDMPDHEVAQQPPGTRKIVHPASVSPEHHGHERQVADGVQDALVDLEELTHLRTTRRRPNSLLQGQPFTPASPVLASQSHRNSASRPRPTAQAQRPPNLLTSVDSALPCPAGRSVPGRGGPERRRRPRPDGTGPSVRAGSVAHRDHKGTSGRQRAPLATRTRRPPSLQLRQLAQRQPADQIVVPKAGGSSPSPNCRRPAALVNKAGSHRGSASPITHSTQNRMRLGHPHGHPDDPSESVWTRPDRRGTQREQVVSVLLRPVRRGASDS